jgi:sec-independent protein translocase protein TatC
VLFAMGATVAFYTLPEALGFLQSMGGDKVQYQYALENYVTLILYMMLAFGLGFQFPILLVFLQLVGVIDATQLAKFRRFAVVIIFAGGAVITPSGDPISLLALSLPMVLFYELSILFGRVLTRRRRRHAV